MSRMRLRVGSRGRLVIPARIRAKLGIRKGSLVSIVDEDGRLVIQPVTNQIVRGIRGSLQGRKSALKMLLEERKHERDL